MVKLRRLFRIIFSIIFGAMTACVSTLADRTLTHEGKVGKALASMGHTKELLGLGKSVALSTVAAVGASEVGQAVSGAPLLVREGAQYGLNVGVRLAGDHGHGALERHLMGALVDKLGEHASREIGALYRGKALENAGLQPSGEGEGLSTGEGAAKDVAVEGGTEGIGYLEHKILHALSGAAQGALLDLKNPAQSALWGAIGAAGAEVAMEAIYDPVARSKALIKEINQRVAQGELPQMLADVGVELTQPNKAGGDEASQRQGVLTRSQSRKQQAKVIEAVVNNPMSNPELLAPLEPLARPHPLGSRNPVLSGTLTPAHHKQLMEGLTQIFTKELRADVERTRDLVRAGLSLGALAAGGQAEQMTMMDGTASQALTHNAIPLVAYVGGAALEAALPGLLASAAGALGITYAWDALTDLFSGSTEQQLPFGNEDEKLRSKGKGRAQEVGQSTAAGCMMPEDPDHEPHDEEPRKDKHSGVKEDGALKGREKLDPILEEKYSGFKDFHWRLKATLKDLMGAKEQLGARPGKPDNETTLNAVKMELRGEQIELAKERGITYNHIEKAKNALSSLKGTVKQLNKGLRAPKLSPQERAASEEALSEAKRLIKSTEDVLFQKLK